MSDKTVTVGDGKTYPTLSAALVAEAADLTSGTYNEGGPGKLIVVCYPISGGDTAIATVTGFTVSSSYYVDIQGSNLTPGCLFDTAKYYMSTGSTGSYAALNILENYTHVTGLQIRCTTTGTWQMVAGIYMPGDAANSVIKNCFTHILAAHDSYLGLGIYGSYVTATLDNCIVCKTGAGTGPQESTGIKFTTDSTVNSYNNTVSGFATNYLSTGTVMVCKNCISHASGTAGYAINTSTGSATNLSDRSDAPDPVAGSPHDLDFVDAAGLDFHLAAGDTEAMNVGTTLGAPYNTDMDGNSRPQGAAYDLGAHEYAAAGPSIPVLMQNRMQQ